MPPRCMTFAYNNFIETMLVSHCHTTNPNPDERNENFWGEAINSIKIELNFVLYA